MEYNALHQILDRMEHTYAHQISSFENQILPDLDAQIKKRQADFLLFQKAVEECLPGIAASNPESEVLDDFITKLERLKHQLTTLTQKVQTHRNDLAQSMKNVTKGKRAMTAYGSPASLRNRSRVITLRN